MRGEDILFEFKDIIESGLYKKEGSLLHLLFGIVTFGIGIINQISSDLIPRTGIEQINTVIDFLLAIPFLFLFIGVMQITLGSAKKFKKFFTLLFRHVSHLYSKTTMEFLVTNYRLIYIVIGEGGLGSTITDFFYDQIEKMTLEYPKSLPSKQRYYLVVGGLIMLIPLFIWLLELTVLISLVVDSILYVVIGGIIIIIGITQKVFRTPYKLQITMNDHRFTYFFIFPPTSLDIDQILLLARQFRLGGNRP
jgi:hypothetical protein